MKRSAIRRINAKRLAARRAITFGAKADWIRSLPCAVREYRRMLDVVECRGGVEAAHVKSRGAGGTSRHTLPLCSGHHHEQHATGIRTFAERYGLDLDAIAARLEAEWEGKR